MDREEYITIDPRDFISPPFIKCPKCHKNSFGILLIRTDRFWRRCKECLFPRPNEKIESFQLPSLKKKIIYLDQLVISEMMKVLNPETIAFKKGKIKKFWFELFELLDNLSKLQLVVCPYSEFHEEESMPFEFRKQLEAMYQLLSGGIKFKTITEILCEQIYQHANNWIKGIKAGDIDLAIKNVVNGNIHGWQKRIIITFPPFVDNDLVEEVRQRRDNSYDQLSEIFLRWQTDSDKSFDDWFKEEWQSFGEITLRMHFENIQRSIAKMTEVLAGQSQLDYSDFETRSCSMVILTIQRVFEKNGICKEGMAPKIKEYLTSDSMKDLPFNRIRALLYATLARKARDGQRKLKSKGIMNDVQFISYLLPYCDAMFIDNECRGLLESFPIKDKIKYKTKIFSQNNKDKFIEYLDEIRNQMSEEHFEKVREIYGEEWLTPYTSLFEK